MSYSRRSRYSYSPSPSPYKRHVRSLSRSRNRSRSHSSDVENPGNNLYVTGLSTRVTKRELERHFASEGNVIDVHLVVDPWTRESRGFGFVTMATVEEADRCIKYLNRSVLEGRVITVEKFLWQQCAIDHVATPLLADLPLIHHTTGVGPIHLMGVGADLALHTVDHQMTTTTEGGTGPTLHTIVTTEGMTGPTLQMIVTTEGVRGPTLQLISTTEGMTCATLQMIITTEGVRGPTLQLIGTTEGMTGPTLHIIHQITDTVEDTAQTLFPEALHHQG